MSTGCAILADVMPANVITLFCDRHIVREQIRQADLLIGAVLVPGALAPRLIERADPSVMRPGAVIVDVAVDQGGCVETTRPTTHSNPAYILDEVVHYCVANIPGAVGRTSTFALCNVTLPWVLRIASLGLAEAATAYPPIARAVNTHRGELTNRSVAEAFGVPWTAYSCGAFAV